MIKERGEVTPREREEPSRPKTGPKSGTGRDQPHQLDGRSAAVIRRRLPHWPGCGRNAVSPPAPTPPVASPAAEPIRSGRSPAVSLRAKTRRGCWLLIAVSDDRNRGRTFVPRPVPKGGLARAARNPIEPDTADPVDAGLREAVGGFGRAEVVLPCDCEDLPKRPIHALD